MTNEIKRKIAIKDYYGKGEHIYEDQMGFDEKHKRKMREEQFPRDLKEAFSMGVRLSRI